MSERGDILSSTVTDEHRRRIRDASEKFQGFCNRLRVPICEEALTIYLTWLAEEGANGRAIKRTISLLDAAEKMDGRAPWSGSPDLQRFVRGLLRDHPIRSGGPRSDPLHVELVHLLVDAVMRPSPRQIMVRAVLHLAYETGMGQNRLQRLEWRHVRFTKRYAELTLPPPANRPIDSKVFRIEGAALVALRQHYAANRHGPGPLFENQSGGIEARLNEAGLGALKRHGGDLQAALAEVSTTLHQINLRALLLLGYCAALRGVEVTAMNQRDVRITEHGLILDIAGRKGPTAIPSDPGQPTDPVAAWESWFEALGQHGRRGPAEPAFPSVKQTFLLDARLQPYRLNDLVQEAVEIAGLRGTYTWTSLRSGLIRTALRDDQQAHDIAAHTDLRSLSSVATHSRRENMLRRSVAGQLGL